MRRCRSVARSVLPRKTITGLFVLVSIVLLPCGAALADTVTSNFDDFSLGTVNGQFGWTSAPPGSGIPGSPTGEFDQAVVSTGGKVPAFGRQALRISNAYASGTFANQTFSARVQDPAAENLPNTEYVAQFSFTTTTPDFQNGLDMSISPDNGVGGRMSWVGLRDTTDGIAVTFNDSPGVDGAFVVHPLALLARGVSHTIKFWIKFNPGPDNDLVRISIDGKDTGQCFTTWENFIRANPDGETGAVLPDINSLQFRTSVAALNVAGGGFLFDNVTVTTNNGPGPPGCDVPIEKTAGTHTVRPGGLAGYRITVHNRGRLSARNLLVCDHIPREMRFVSADRKLLHLGRRRCLAIARLAPGKRDSFHLVLRVNANATPGTVDNIADETPEQPPGSPLAPASPLVPTTPPADVPGNGFPPRVAPITPIKKVKAIVRIVKKRVRPHRPPPPIVTG